MNRLVAFLVLFLIASSSQATGFDYKLSERVVELAEGTYVVQGETNHFSRNNGGNVLNTAFIVSDEGVLVIDTGPSLRYGQQLRALIASITDAPIKRVLMTHHHPDHFFGNQAFEDVPIYATALTRQEMAAHADGYSDAMYRLVGRAMFGTEYVLPTETIQAGDLDFGGHQLQLLEMSGHTASELVIHDQSTGVLFTGDLVFNGRAPTTPHADLARWLEALKKLESLAFRIMVPGHGLPVESKQPIAETAEYLQWLSTSLQEAAAQGATAAEALHRALPQAFGRWGAMPGEYQRSVHHLFPAYEEQNFYQPRSLERN